NLSHHTVGHHIHRILRKTNSANRAEAVAYAQARALLPALWQDHGAGDEPPRHKERSGLDQPIREPQSLEPPSRVGHGSDAVAGERPGRAEGRTRGVPYVTVLPSGKESQAPKLQRTVDRLSRGLQQALWDPNHWHDVLHDFGRAFGSHVPMVSWTDYTSVGASSATVSPDMGADWIAKYDEYYVRFVPTWDVIRLAPGDFFITSDEISFPPGFEESPFYTEYMRNLDMHRSVAWTVFLDQRWCVTLFLAQSAPCGRARRASTARASPQTSAPRWQSE
ncbi:MAG: hypothetical protein GVY29_03135, partial [Spirochaetes bacterium]|nr:hypothetical protein [Spirochaetota bacterium]